MYNIFVKKILFNLLCFPFAVLVTLPVFAILSYLLAITLQIIGLKKPDQFLPSILMPFTYLFAFLIAFYLVRKILKFAQLLFSGKVGLSVTKVKN